MATFASHLFSLWTLAMRSCAHPSPGSRSAESCRQGRLAGEGNLGGAPRPGDVKDSQADISKARRLLGYGPSVSFEEGLARTVAWYRDSHATVA